LIEEDALVSGIWKRVKERKFYCNASGRALGNPGAAGGEVVTTE
jgi:hypothetical protein